MNKLLIMIGVVGFFWAGVAQADHYECTSGCTVTTCDGTVCNVYYCEAGDCTYQGSYPDPNAEDQEIEPNSTGSPGFSPAPGSESRKPLLYCGVPSGCAVSTCAGNECQVFGFHQGRMSELGTVGTSVQEAQALLKLFQAENLLGRSRQ